MKFPQIHQSAWRFRFSTRNGLCVAISYLQWLPITAPAGAEIDNRSVRPELAISSLNGSFVSILTTSRQPRYVRNNSSPPRRPPRPHADFPKRWPVFPSSRTGVRPRAIVPRPSEFAHRLNDWNVPISKHSLASQTNPDTRIATTALRCSPQTRPPRRTCGFRHCRRARPSRAAMQSAPRGSSRQKWPKAIHRS